MDKILLLDNYDSFTFNLAHAIEEVKKGRVDVIKNDQINMEQVEAYDYIILSPGPGLPEDAGLLKSIIEKFAPTKKIFAVCLGLQAVAEVYGSKLKNLSTVYHGIQTEVQYTDSKSVLYNDIEDKFLAGRYHSWVVDRESLGEELIITAFDPFGEVMSLQHKVYPTHAVQYHPESILTEPGLKIIENFFSYS